MKKADFINTVHENAGLDISRKLTGEIIDTTFNGSPLSERWWQVRIPWFRYLQHQGTRRATGHQP